MRGTLTPPQPLCHPATFSSPSRLHHDPSWDDVSACAHHDSSGYARFQSSCPPLQATPVRDDWQLGNRILYGRIPFLRFR